MGENIKKNKRRYKKEKYRVIIINRDKIKEYIAIIHTSFYCFNNYDAIFFFFF